MGIFSKRFGKPPMDALHCGETLREAFYLGEVNDTATRK
jgi:hypothetical protein